MTVKVVTQTHTQKETSTEMPSIRLKRKIDLCHVIRLVCCFCDIFAMRYHHFDITLLLSPPYFTTSQPLCLLPPYLTQYLRWSAHNRPHLFFAFAIGIAGPVAALTLTPLRRKYLYPDHSPLPQSYPREYYRDI